MRSLFSLLSPLLLGALPVGAASIPPAVHYVLAPEMSGDAISALRVTVTFAGDPSGTTNFDWAAGWAEESRMGQWARDITVIGARSLEPAPHGGRIIHAAPGAALTVSYRIVSAYAADPSAQDSRQPRPVIRPTWFYAVGEALFATPQGNDDAPARFGWNGPADVGFASDLEHDRARPGRAKTIADITESVVIGGRDLDIQQVMAGGAPLRIATVGRYGFELGAFQALAQRIVAAERTFWNDKDPQPFLITMTPVTPVASRLSYSGTGRSDAFALWMDPGAELSGIGRLLAHEYFHRWNYRQLGSMADGQAEPLSYWLSEGFTDFYARRLLLRAGLMTPAQFAESWNEALASYAASPFRVAASGAVAAQAWKDQSASKLPYYKGAMLAAMWDARARAGGKTNLDAVLRDQRRRAATSRPPAITDLFIRTAAALGLDVRGDVARYIDRGEAVMLPPNTFGDCASVDTITRPVFSRGWDVTATAKAGVVTGLDPASPAYAAGLRDGMTIVRRTAGTPGDSRFDFTMIVADLGVERGITFRPAGRGTETLQQIVLDQVRFAATPAACTASLAG